MSHEPHEVTRPETNGRPSARRKKKEKAPRLVVCVNKLEKALVILTAAGEVVAGPGRADGDAVDEAGALAHLDVLCCGRGDEAGGSDDGGELHLVMRC